MSLYAYDEGLLNYLKSAMSFDNIINSAESKAFDNWIDSTEEVKIMFPLISFWRIANPITYESGGNWAWKHRGKLESKDAETFTGKRFRALPIDISYQITIWSDYRKQVDDIFRELVMYLMVDEPLVDVKFDEFDDPIRFVLQVMDTSPGYDVDSFGNRGKIYTHNIIVNIPEAQLIFSREIPLVKDVPLHIFPVDNSIKIEEV